MRAGFDSRWGYQFGKMAEWFNVPVSKTGAPFKGAVGSNPTLSAKFNGRVTEWFIVLVLKTSVPKGTVGSNPTSSANFIAACSLFSYKRS